MNVSTIFLQALAIAAIGLFVMVASFDMSLEFSVVGTFFRAIGRRDFPFAARVLKDGLVIAGIRLRNLLGGLGKGRTLILFADEFGGIKGPTNIGDHVKMVSGQVPASRSSGTTEGANFTTGVDRTGYESVLIVAHVGAGTITSVDLKIRHCDTVGGTYADFQPDGTAASGAITQITAQNSIGTKNINLLGAKQFITLSLTLVSTNLLTSTELVLGGANTEPATNTQ